MFWKSMILFHTVARETTQAENWKQSAMVRKKGAKRAVNIARWPRHFCNKSTLAGISIHGLPMSWLKFPGFLSVGMSSFLKKRPVQTAVENKKFSNVDILYTILKGNFMLSKSSIGTYVRKWTGGELYAVDVSVKNHRFELDGRTDITAFFCIFFSLLTFLMRFFGSEIWSDRWVFLIWFLNYQKKMITIIETDKLVHLSLFWDISINESALWRRSLYTTRFFQTI